MGHTLDQIFNFAVRWANKNHHEYLTLELILFSLLEDNLIMEVMNLCGANLENFKSELHEFLNNKSNFSILTHGQIESLGESQFANDNIRQIAKSSGIFYQPEMTVALQRVLQRAAMHIQSSGKKDIRAIHILIALFEEEESQAIYLLNKYQISRTSVIQVVAHSLDQASNIAPSEDGGLQENLQEQLPSQGQPLKSKDALEEFATHLNQRAIDGKIDPLVGRKNELKRIIQILCRRRKNNPLLVGDAGVGKTALAEGLALKIESGQVPEVINKMQIYSLNMTSLLAGTKYRGDFEARFKGLLKALEKREEKGMKPLLFIDEIHTIMGAGMTAGGGVDASSLLKPLLSHGDIRCMGSTTFEEFRQFIEKDPALTRRFQKIEIKEPSEDESYKILMGIKSTFEKHHKVKFSSSTIKSAVQLSNKYITDRRLPDKAIDVIDELGSFLQLQKKKKIQATVMDVEHIVAEIARVPRASISGDEKEKIKNLHRSLKMLIFGQDHAVERVCHAITLSRSGLGKKSGPIASFLFAGPTGVGKTELARQLAYHLGVHLTRIDMSEYMEKTLCGQVDRCPSWLCRA